MRLHSANTITFFDVHEIQEKRSFCMLHRRTHGFTVESLLELLCSLLLILILLLDPADKERIGRKGRRKERRDSS